LRLVTASRVSGNRAEDGVIEDGVGDQTAGIVSFAVGRQLQWVAGTAIDRAVAFGVTLELGCVKRLDVPSMILIEVREAVVEVYVRTDIVRDAELEGADSGVCDVDGAVRRSPRLGSPAPLWSSEVGRFEGVGILVLWNVREVGSDIGSVTSGVIN
jgi:hypothetical protein